SSELFRLTEAYNSALKAFASHFARQSSAISCCCARLVPELLPNARVLLIQASGLAASRERRGLCYNAANGLGIRHQFIRSEIVQTLPACLGSGLQVETELRAD